MTIPMAGWKKSADPAHPCSAWIERRRRVAIALAVGLAAVALTLMLRAMALAAPLGFLHVRSNLSQTPARVSGQPDLALSPDGDRVAVVWTEEYRSGVGYAKGHVYLQAASESGGAWGSKVRVYTGTDSAYAYDAAVAVTGTTAHVAYVVFVNDPRGSLERVLVQHRTCSLSTGRCGGESPLVASVSVSDGKITWVDLALDAEGEPHIVWAQYDASGQNGRIYYRGWYVGGWSSATTIAEPSSTDNDVPVIAWADGYVHVVWQETKGTGHRIAYRRRPTAEAGGSWESIVMIFPYQVQLLPRNPDVAARAGKVFVVWDWCANRDAAGVCTRYTLRYRRSNTNGALWDPDTHEIRVGAMAEYSSLDSEVVRHEYLLDLQPSIALSRNGWPTVVWHADRSGGAGTDYAIYYTEAFTVTADTYDPVTWITPTVLLQSAPIVQGSAAVGVGEPEPGEQHMHAAYVQKTGQGGWDVYYDSNEGDRYRYLVLPLIMRVR